MLAPWENSYDKPRQCIKKQRHHFADKIYVVKLCFLVVMYGCESWTIQKVERWRIDTFEMWCWGRLLRVLDGKEIQPVHPKGNQSWIFIGSIDAEAEAPVLWPPDVKNGFIGKYPDSAKDWTLEEKGMTEDEMAGCHHYLMDINLSKLWEVVLDRNAWYAAGHGITKSQTRMSNWTELDYFTNSRGQMAHTGQPLLPSLNHSTTRKWNSQNGGALPLDE